MRALLGTTGPAIRRRWAGLDRLATLTLTRDQFAESPGSNLTLRLGERTHYRAAAWILDEFLREDGLLGDRYGPPDAMAALAIEAFGVTAAVDDDALEVQRLLLPRDQWAEATLETLDAAGAEEVLAGVGVRFTEEGTAATGYVAEAVIEDSGGDRFTRLIKYDAGTPTELEEILTPWQTGDVLRLTAEWDRLRVYRQGVLILDWVDATDPILTTGRAALRVLRLDAADTARLTAFVGGPLREEYAGIIADMGDASASLGLLEPTASPAAFDLTVVNIAPIGGADRFAALIRHGLNDGAGTYDLPRAEARVMTAFRGGSAPLTVAVGLVDQVGGMTEDRLRLSCVGRDAFVTPSIVPGVVTYLPGPDPLLETAPVADDPACGFDAVPEVVPGDPPAEPPPLDDEVVAGVDGPEAPAPPPSGGGQLYGIAAEVSGPDVVVPAVLVTNFKTLDNWSPVDDGNLYLDEEWTIDDFDGPGQTNPDYRIVLRMMFRTGGWAGTYLTGEIFEGLRLVFGATYGNGPPVTEPATEYTFPEITMRIVEYGVPNPFFDEELPPSEDNPVYVPPSTQEQIEEFLATLTWADWVDPAAPFVLNELVDYVIPESPANGSGGIGTPALISRNSGIVPAGDAFGQFIGSARWIALRVDIAATTTPPSGFGWFASSVTINQTDFLDDKLTMRDDPDP